MRHRMIAICVLVLAGCERPAQEAPTPVPVAPPLPPLSELSPRDALIECAGAIVAQAGLDPHADPSLDTPEENAYFVVLALMDKERGLEGVAGRETAAASSDAWLQRSAEQRSARASQCQARFGVD